MALPSSGQISLLDLQNEYGGSSPISMSEYYRNGPYVPNSITSGTVRDPSSGDYYVEGYYSWITQVGTNEVVMIQWDGSTIFSYDGSSFTSITIGGYTYYRGDFRKETDIPSWQWYGLYRTYSTTILVNQNVPTSGQISLSNFYGGRKT